MLEHLGAESEFDVLGLFQGVGLPFRSESAPAQMPNMVWLYRRPILDYWAEQDEGSGGGVSTCSVTKNRATISASLTPTWEDRTGCRPTRQPERGECRTMKKLSDRSFQLIRSASRSTGFAMEQRTHKGRQPWKNSPPSRASPRRSKMINVDTDMIIPKQYLKTIKRTGSGGVSLHEPGYPGGCSGPSPH